MDYADEDDIDDLRTRAQAGDSEAQHRLGMRYELGAGVPRNLRTALRWQQRAADGGQRYGMASVARAYHHGRGVACDHAAALHWYERALAAGVGVVGAQIGELLAFSDTVPRDLPRAIALLTAAFEGEGDPVYAAALAAIHWDQLGEPVCGRDWFLRAAELGHTPSMVQLGYRYRTGDGVPRNLALMFGWYVAAAREDDVDGLANLAACYANGEGVRKDLRMAQRIRARAAELGHVPSQRWLALALLDGTGVERDPEEGLRRLEALAARDAETAHDLGVRLVEGVGVEADVERGVAWLERAAEAGDGGALSYLGVLAWYGGRVPEDRGLAVERYRRAAELGDPYGAANLGFALMEGEVVPRDVPGGIALVEQGAAGGNPRAALWLAQRHLAGDGGFQQDASAARQVLEGCLKAEEDGDVLFLLAELVRDGVGGAADPERACVLFERAQVDGRDARVEIGVLRRALRQRTNTREEADLE